MVVGMIPVSVRKAEAITAAKFNAHSRAIVAAMMLRRRQIIGNAPMAGPPFRPGFGPRDHVNNHPKVTPIYQLKFPLWV
jgi:hypothetical protein